MKVINYLGDKLGSGGIESFLVNITSGLNDKGIQPIVLSVYSSNSIYKDKFTHNGVKVVALTKERKSYGQKLLLYAKYMHKNNDAILHIHASSPGMYTYALIAKIAGVKHIIYHIHSTRAANEKKTTIIKNSILRRFLSGIPNYNIACSKEAGKDVFKNKDFKVISNGIDIDRFRFNENSRLRMRKELNIENKFVIGQVGRFSPQKNQLFTLKIIHELVKTDKNVRLVLVGEGSDEDKIRQYINDNGLEDYVRIIKPVANIEDYYSAFDLFVLPSKWEGFGIVALEAQVSGLISIFSEYVIQDVILFEETKSISINNNAAWETAIMQIALIENKAELMRDRSKRAVNKCIARGYSFDFSRDALIAIYKKIIKNDI